MEVHATQATNIEDGKFTLHGELTDLGEHETALVYFEYGENDPLENPVKTKYPLLYNGATDFEITEDEVDLSKDYYFRAAVENWEVTEGQEDYFANVTDSEEGMDSITDSEGAMDVVIGDITARTTLISSPYVVDTLWSKEMASEKFWEGTTINPNSGEVEGIPYRYQWDGGNGDADPYIEFSTEIPSHFNGGFSLKIDSSTYSVGGDGYANNDEAHSEYLFDLTEINTFKIWLYDPDENELYIWVDGEKSTRYTPSSWTQIEIDVSDKSGETVIGVGSNNDTVDGIWYWTGMSFK